MDTKTILILVLGSILLLIAGLLVGRHTKATAEAKPVPGVPPPVPHQHLGKVQGLDVSHYQGVVNWESVKEAGNTSLDG